MIILGKAGYVLKLKKVYLKEINIELISKSILIRKGIIKKKIFN